jgi:hypothetical protein
MKRIIFKNDEGGVSVVVPAPNVKAEDIAQKVVPTGKPYKIVDVADIPSDRTLRDAWTVDEATLTDGVGG